MGEICYLLTFFSFAIFYSNFIENFVYFPNTHCHIFITTIFQNIIRYFSEITALLCTRILLYTKIQSKSPRTCSYFHLFYSLTISFHRHYLWKYLTLRLNVCLIYSLSIHRQYVLDPIVVIITEESSRMNLEE